MLSESVKAWNNEAERKRTIFVIKQQLGYYKAYKNIQKRVAAIMPTEVFVGEPVPVEREMNDVELREAREKERKRKEKELQMLEAEKEAKSLIPLNIDYEVRIFDRRNKGRKEKGREDDKQRKYREREKHCLDKEIEVRNERHRVIRLSGRYETAD